MRDKTDELVATDESQLAITFESSYKVKIENFAAVEAPEYKKNGKTDLEALREIHRLRIQVGEKWQNMDSTVSNVLHNIREVSFKDQIKNRKKCNIRSFKIPDRKVVWFVVEGCRFTLYWVNCIKRILL